MALDPPAPPDPTAPDPTLAPPAPGTPTRPRITRTLVGVGLVIMLAGVLFGYDQGVISGALDGITKEFRVSTFLLEVITSWVTLGGMADRLGRRMTILAASVLFTVGALIEALAPGS